MWLLVEYMAWLKLETLYQCSQIVVHAYWKCWLCPTPLLWEFQQGHFQLHSHTTITTLAILISFSTFNFHGTEKDSHNTLYNPKYILSINLFLPCPNKRSLHSNVSVFCSHLFIKVWSYSMTHSWNSIKNNWLLKLMSPPTNTVYFPNWPSNYTNHINLQNKKVKCSVGTIWLQSTVSG